MHGRDSTQKQGQSINDPRPLEAQNLSEIEGLNQRGGRMLSMVDLLEAGTLSVNMAGYLLFAIRHGASILTGARPGGAGKTALLGAILNLLPPGEKLVTVARNEVLRSAPQKPACLLAHEIGGGPYYGYIWSDDVPAFFGKAAEGYRIAATIHADDAGEVREELSFLGVSDEALSHVAVMAFIQAERRGWKARHTVHSIYECNAPGSHRLLFRAEGSRFVQEHPSELAEETVSEEEFRACCGFFEHLSCRPDLASVRRKILECYAGRPL